MKWTAFLFLLVFAQAHAQPGYPLSSWNDGPAKKAIVEFVKSTTEKGSPQFVAPEARIATFDQDGTTWVEQPMYTQVIYCLERVPAVVQGEAGLERRSTLQDRALRQPGGDGEVHDATAGDDSCSHLDRHVGGRVHAEAKKWLEAARIRAGSGLIPSHIPADAGSAELLACQRLQDLHRDGRRPGLRAGLLRAGLRHPAGAGGWHGGRTATATPKTANCF